MENKRLMYADLSDEDRVLMGALFDYKTEQTVKRASLRLQIEDLKRQEADCTKEIMNLSQRKISEKFDICPHSAKPLSAKEKSRIINKDKARIGVMPASKREEMKKAIVRSRARNKESLFSIPVFGRG